MKMRTVVVLVLAMACGVSAAVGVNQLRQRQGNGPSSEEVETVPVVTAAIDAPRGSVITIDSVRIHTWPKSMVPDGAIATIEDAVDRCVLVPLVKGEPILQTKLADVGAGHGLAAMIPKGMRAFTIRTPHVAAGVGGFMLPGNRVDILLTTSSSADDVTGGGATTTLLQNVTVLAVAQRLDAPESNKVDPKEASTVTLLVTPDQAAKLDLGMNRGILHLALRNPEDNAEADARPATMAQLRFHQEKPWRAPSEVGRVAGLLAGVLARTPYPAPETEAETEPPPPPRARVTHIQTLRGVHRGSVRIEHPR